jgi:hypothetical protein
MDNQQRALIIENAKQFFRDEIAESHINGACERASKLSEYNVNPFLFKYLANFLTGNDDSVSIARALVLPRILGSSITTSCEIHSISSIPSPLHRLKTIHC